MSFESKEIKINTFFWIVLCIGFFLVSIFPSAFRIDSQIITIPFRAFVLFFSGVIILRKFFQKSFKEFGIVEIAFVVFWIIYFLKAVYSFQNYFFIEKNNSQEIETYLKILGVTFLPSLAILNLKRQDFNFKISFKIIFFLVLLVLFLNILFGIEHDKNGRSSGFMSMYPISFGYWGVTLVLLSLYQILYKVISQKYFLYLSYLGVIIGLTIIYASGTRSTLVAIIVGAFFLFYSKGMKKIMYSFTIAIIFGVIALLVYNPQTIGNKASSFFTRVTQTIKTGDSSGREVFYELAIQIFKQNPIIGGRILYADGMYPHNVFLEVLMATGIIGFVVYFLFFKDCIKYIIKVKSVAEIYPETIWIAVLWIQYFILSLFSYNLHSSPEVWYLTAMVLVLNKDFK